MSGVKAHVLLRLCLILYISMANTDICWPRVDVANWQPTEATSEKKYILIDQQYILE
jgi:hypothetical protein